MTVKPFPTFTPYRKATVFDEVRGSLAPGFTSAVLRKGGEWRVDGHLTYEDVVLLGSGFFGIVTSSGSVSPWTFSYTGPSGSQPSLQSYTFEYNQTAGVVQATGCIMNRLQLTGAAMDHWEYSVSGFAQDIDASTGSITSGSDRTVEVALVGTSALFMDPSGSTIGSTPFTGTLLDFTLDMENSAKPIYTAGSLVPAQWVIGGKIRSSLTLDLLYTAAVKTYMTGTLMLGTRGLIRIKSTSGSKSIQLDFAGVLSDEPALFGNKEEAQTVSLKLDSVYDPGAALYTNLTCVTTAGSTVP
jgi:hypothetical protein